MGQAGCFEIVRPKPAPPLGHFVSDEMTFEFVEAPVLQPDPDGITFRAYNGIGEAGGGMLNFDSGETLQVIAQIHITYHELKLTHKDENGNLSFEGFHHGNFTIWTTGDKIIFTGDYRSETLNALKTTQRPDGQYVSYTDTVPFKGPGTGMYVGYAIQGIASVSLGEKPNELRMVLNGTIK